MPSSVIPVTQKLTQKVTVPVGRLSKLTVSESGGGGGVTYPEWVGGNLANLTYAGTFDTSPQGTNNGYGIELSSDGTKMYVNNAQFVYQYTLSTAWDITTAAYDSKSLSLQAGGAGANSLGIAFSPDGTRMYSCYAYSGTNAMYEYDLSTAWDISTAVYNGNSIDPGHTARDCAIAFDGSYAYTIDANTDRVRQYALSIPYDLSSAGAPVDFSLTGIVANGGGLYVSPDGTKAYASDYGIHTVYEFSLSTPYDFTTASYIQNSGNLSATSSEHHGVFFKPDGTEMYVIEKWSFKTYQYHVGA